MSKSQTIFGNFYSDPSDYIPISCHYDDKTLITKNGELIQVIKIDGITERGISKNISALRGAIRNALKEHINDASIACWIHTIRSRVNLDDPKPYPTLLSQNIHDMWVKKNYWHNKYANTVFISFVYKGYNFKITDAHSLRDSFKPGKIYEIHDANLAIAREKLEAVVAPVTAQLQEFAARRLGMVYGANDDVYCEMLGIYHSVIRGVAQDIKVGEHNLSETIGTFNYAIGDNKIEVISGNSRKYAAIISLKEYQELSPITLDKVLQQPTEFVITEVLNFVPPKEVEKFIAHQAYIAKVANDPDLLQSKGIKQIIESEQNNKIPYCAHQIYALLLNEDLGLLERTTANFSFQLSRIGLVHVREDINIENAFWAQIPGNFKFLKRMCYASIDDIAPMASLYNFPAGDQNNPIGLANTILRTERGSPYFFNFHDQENNANCVLVGPLKSGKNTTMNFLISESMKYDPYVAFYTFTKDSYAFVKASNGAWMEGPLRVDPFKLAFIRANAGVMSEIIDTIFSVQDEGLTQEELSLIAAIKNGFMSLPDIEKTYIKLLEMVPIEEAYTNIRVKISNYLPGGEFYEYFNDAASTQLSLPKVFAIDFAELSNEAFIAKHYPTEDRFLPEYNVKLAKFKIFREIIFTSNIFRVQEIIGNQLLITNIELYNYFSSFHFSEDFYHSYHNNFKNQNSIYLASTLFSVEDEFFNSDLWRQMNEFFSTKLYLSAESVISTWKDKLFLTEDEYKKLKAIIPVSRLFLLKRKDYTITCELSLGGFKGILKILTSDAEINAKVDEYIAQKGSDPNEWLIEFYNTIR